jgi:hypothetical protein
MSKREQKLETAVSPTALSSSCSEYLPEGSGQIPEGLGQIPGSLGLVWLC